MFGNTSALWCNQKVKDSILSLSCIQILLKWNMMRPFFIVISSYIWLFTVLYIVYTYCFLGKLFFRTEFSDLKKQTNEQTQIPRYLTHEINQSTTKMSQCATNFATILYYCIISTPTHTHTLIDLNICNPCASLKITGEHFLQRHPEVWTTQSRILLWEGIWEAH